MTDNPTFSRRTAVGGALCLTAALAACGGSDDDSGSSQPTASAGTELGPTSDVPVGGGKVYGDQKIVVTQPTAGSYKGFTAVCTHQGCTVATVTDGEIVCTCHNSHFSATDGSVVSGPAQKALASEAIKVSGSAIYVA